MPDERKTPFMTTSISDTTASAQPLAAPTANRPAPQPPQPQVPADTVSLSQFAQVSQMNEEGETPSEIADALGIAVSTVDTDLGIPAATVAATPTAAPVASAPAAASTKATSAG